MGRHYRTIGARRLRLVTIGVVATVGAVGLIGATVGATTPTLNDAARVGTQAVRFNPPPPALSAHQQTLLGVLDAINAARGVYGLSPVTPHGLVEVASQLHAEDMAARRLMTHTGWNGSDGGDRLTAAGFVWSEWGENVGAGFADPALLVQSWMTSPGHRSNLLGNFTYIGVGVAPASDGTLYWALTLAT